ncbi:PrpR N-terminal domain-containing protein [Halobacillus mangrovi]|uniref:Sigma-54 factor interaction domain-containing protein n=1 Tax=Halobacillus mangrovi TaxID=402384 RepID=A0A1W5ZZF6_9BACI|nr:sigma-54-dependent transcriptional regulator [Halobacillus mangrovi]ARI78673.1 hypothetical protein HM131_18310 [Halobacillus mangrovi]
MIKALVVAPYEGLVEIVKEISHEVDDIHLTIKKGNLKNGLKIALDAQEEYDLIISRGGTASLIQDHVGIPVIDIQVSGYDILRNLTLVKGFVGKACIVAFPNISRGAATICDILDLNIETMTITKDHEVERRLSELKNSGFEVVIGDVITVEAAKKMGLNGVLITSGKEAILESLEEARRVYRLFSRLNADLSRYQAILEKDNRLIFIISSTHKVIYCNHSSLSDINEEEFGSTKEIQKIVEETLISGEKKDKSVVFHDYLWKVSSSLHEENVILYLEKLFHQNLFKDIDTGQFAVEIIPDIPFTPITGRSDSTKKVLYQINKFSKTIDPIWIEGEEGNGKDLIARSIYSSKEGYHEPFIIMHCHLLSADQLRQIIQAGFSQNVQSTVYLRRIETLSRDAQHLLLSLIKKLNQYGNSPRWITSSGVGAEAMVRKGMIDRDLYDELSRFVIKYPPLRERKEDIKNLIQLFISENHTKYGKQVIGVRDDALVRLINYDWPGNVRQLKQTIEQLVQEAQSYYIGMEQVQTILEKMEFDPNNDALSNDIDLTLTLEEIEKQIIQKVLEEEEMNQSKAAARLGINRTTLWRKLK